MSPQFLFNSSIAFIVSGLILIFNGFFVFAVISFIIAVSFWIFWFFSGLFDKFESTPPEIEGPDDKDEEGKGVLKPF